MYIYLHMQRFGKQAGSLALALNKRIVTAVNVMRLNTGYSILNIFLLSSFHFVQPWTRTNPIAVLPRLWIFRVHNTQVPFIFINRVGGFPPGPFCYEAALFISEWLCAVEVRGSINGIDFLPSIFWSRGSALLKLHSFHHCHREGGAPWG
jgi:hypothetical protein